MQILSIAYYRSGQYTWQLALNAGEPPQTESDIPLPSIEACLQEAGNGLIEEDPYVQLWYRGFCMGTVRADCLPSEATEIAERIVAAYAGLRVRA